MRPLRALVIYLTLVFIGGSLLAPLAYSLVHAAGSWNPWFHKLEKFSFDRYVTRSCELLALVGLWPFLKCVGILGWREIGLCPPKTEWRRLAVGLMLGFVSLAIVAGVAIIAGARSPRSIHSAAKLLQHIVTAGLTAIFIATIEEVLFRGVMFSAFRKACGWITALVLSSGIFALLHFLGDANDPHPVTWLSGFVSFGEMLDGLLDLQQLVPGFLALFLVGAILALGYQRTGNLYFSIGLHAGWIFWQKSYGFLTRAAGNPDSFWGSGKLRDGWFAFLILIFVLGILLKWPSLFGRNQNSNERSEINYRE